MRLPRGDDELRMRVAGVACGARHTLVWLENGGLFGFGNNSFGQLGFDFREERRIENEVRRACSAVTACMIRGCTHVWKSGAHFA